jgi:leader peptidase (prepilin peptidase)/N-methyltransferase
MELALTLLLGLVIGSFLNVCIARLPHGESVVHPRSRCPRCRKAIRARDNIPVISYLLLGGRCRHCRAAISLRYPFVEALTAVVSVLLCIKFGFTIHWAIYFLFCSALIVLALIDADHRILPDPITVNGIWIGVVTSVLLIVPSPFASWLFRQAGIESMDTRLQSLFGSMIGAAVGGGLLWAVAAAYLRFRGVEGMGFGDVKMMAMVGAFLGAPLALFTIMVGSLVGSVVGLALMQFAGKSREYELPFGTFLGFAGIVAVLYGDALLRMYMDRVMPEGL